MSPAAAADWPLLAEMSLFHSVAPVSSQGGRSLGRNLLRSDFTDWPAGGGGLAGRLPDGQADQSDEARSLQPHRE